MMRQATGGVAPLAPEATAQPAWQERLTGEYESSLQKRRDGLRTKLSAQLHSLTGRWITHASVYVRTDGQMAVANVDGVTFRLYRGRGLVMVRHCDYCGTGYFESLQVESQEDLGYALSAWTPLHEDCEELIEAEELADW